jgi:succinoglycan biosynthesis transport protein ExoP
LNIEGKILAPLHALDIEPERQPADAGISFEFILDFLRRRLWTILLFVALFTSVAIAYFFLVPAPYTAVATLEIDTRRFQLFQQPGAYGEQLIDSSSAVESQLEVLKSENIALKVIQDLKLADDPDFGMADPIPIISRLMDSGGQKSEFARTRNALRIFQNSLKVKRLGIAFVIEISFQSPNAVRSAQIANAVAEVYIADQLASKYKGTRHGSNWLEGRIKELREQVETAQKDIIEYKAKNNLIEAGQGRMANDQQVGELTTQLIGARTKADEAGARLARITEILNSDSRDASIINAGGEFINNNAFITRLRTQYLEAASREAEWAKKYGRDHQAAANLRANMAAIITSVRTELVRLRESFNNDYELAKAAEHNIEIQLKRAVSVSKTSNEAQVRLRELETSAAAYKTLHDNFLRRYTEAVEQQSFPYTEARLITDATPPLQRTYKKTLLILALMPMLGLALGVGAGALRDFRDRGFRTSGQVESLLGTTCLALIPLYGPDPAKKSITDLKTSLPLADESPDGHRNEKAPGRNPISAVIDHPFSRFAEEIRSLKLAADLNGALGSDKVIGLTSSVPGEGKSTIAASLAQCIANTGSRVIMVDCDIRHPSLSLTFAPGATIGLLEVLSGEASVDQALRKVSSGNLVILPATAKSRVPHSSEILASNNLRRLFDTLRTTYDYIIVDLPPLAPLVDVRATAHFVDHYIFIIEWGKTSTDVARHALSRAPLVYKRLLGAALNKVEMKQLALYDGNRAKYYHNETYSRYGYHD